MRFIVTQKYNLPTFSIALQIMFYFENFDNFWCADTRINFQPNSKRLSLLQEYSLVKAQKWVNVSLSHDKLTINPNATHNKCSNCLSLTSVITIYIVRIVSLTGGERSLIMCSRF